MPSPCGVDFNPLSVTFLKSWRLHKERLPIIFKSGACMRTERPRCMSARKPSPALPRLFDSAPRPHHGYFLARRGRPASAAIISRATACAAMLLASATRAQQRTASPSPERVACRVGGRFVRLPSPERVSMPSAPCRRRQQLTRRDTSDSFLAEATSVRGGDNCLYQPPPPGFRRLVSTFRAVFNDHIRRRFFTARASARSTCRRAPAREQVEPEPRRFVPSCDSA